MCWKVEKPENVLVYCECLNGKELEPRTVTLLNITLLFLFVYFVLPRFHPVALAVLGSLYPRVLPELTETHLPVPSLWWKACALPQLPVLAVLLESRFQKELSYA